jgi:Nif-specific regulatory protein
MPLARRFAEFLARLRSGATERERARLAALLGLNRELVRASDLRALLDLLLDEAIALFGAERGFVLRMGADGYTVASARSLDREALRQPERKVSRTVVQRCIERREGIYSADAQEGDLGASQSIADLKLRSVLCMPLIAGDELLGLLYLDHRFQSGAFQPDDLPWLQAFADQAAVAVHLHALREQDRARAEAIAERNRELESRVGTQERELAELEAGTTRAELTHPFPAIAGESPPLVRSLRRLERVLDAAFPVLLLGESGTGKELFARALHEYGRRAGGPYVAVNVAAFQPSLIASELFGHRRGAFTGADRDRPGLLRSADRGVLFLDEVTELDPEVQAMLLRFLEDGIVRPVGGEHGERVDVRIVAATNRDPLGEIAAHRLRADLYYRLAVVTIELPPLRDRSGDVPPLAERFLAEAARARGTAPRRLSEACVAELVRRRWPGNLRELRNEMFRLDALAEGDPIGPDQLSPASAAPAGKASLDLRHVEQEAIRAALAAAGGNKSEAARLLGISRRALYHKLQGD